MTDVSDDGRRIAYRTPGSRNGLVVAGLADGSTHRLPTGPWTDTDVAFGAGGETLLLRRLNRDADDGRATLEVWDVRRERMLMRYDRGNDDGALPVLSSGDRHIAWCARDATGLRVLDTGKGRLVTGDIPEATERALCQGEDLTFTPDGRAVASGTSEGIVTWDFRAGRERPRLPIAAGAIQVEFAGPYALAWGLDTFTLWRTDLPDPADDAPREPLLTYPVAGRTIGDIRLDPAQDVLRYREGGRTSVVRTLSLHGLMDDAWHSRAAERVPRNRIAGTEILARDPDGRTALTAEGVLVDTETGEPRPGIKGVQGEDYLRAAAFSRDGRSLAVADGQGRVTLWDKRTWRRTAVLRAVGSTVHEETLAFSADGSLLAVGAPDGSVHVWETATPSLPPAVLPVGDGPPLALRFTSGDGALRVGTAHLAERLVPLSPDRAAATVCERADGGLTEAQWRRWFPSAGYRPTCGEA